MTNEIDARAGSLGRLQPGELGRWWRAGTRTALLRAPRADDLAATPVLLAPLAHDPATWLRLLGETGMRAAAHLPFGWQLLALVVLLGRAAMPRRGLAVAVSLCFLAAIAALTFSSPGPLWYADAPDGAETDAEELRRTRSFEQAHARARELIRQREIDAGKDDGYSNPQLALGAALRPVLQRLEARLDAQDAALAASSPR